MSKLLEKIQDAHLPACFSDSALLGVISGTDDQRYGQIKRAIASGHILHIRRGLYCLAERYRNRPLNLYLIAGEVYGPSYVSFESALSYHGWIPEAVGEVTCASVRRSAVFETPVGIFSYTRIPARLFMDQVERIVDGRDVFFMARPWRALADYVYAGRKDWKGIHPLIHSLRIDEDELRSATREELEELDRSFGKKRVSMFLDGVIEELRL